MGRLSIKRGKQPDQHAEHSPLIAIASEDDSYGGSVIEVISSHAPKSYLIAKQGGDNGEKVFEVTGTGSVETRGGANFMGEQGLYVRHHTTLSGGLSISKAEVLAGATITVPSEAAYVQVLDDSNDEANELVLGGHSIGQVLMVTNGDQQPLYYSTAKRALKCPLKVQFYSYSMV